MFACSCILSLQPFLLWFDGSDGVGLAGRSCLSLPVCGRPAGWSVLGQALGWQFQLGAATVWLAGEVEKTQSCRFLYALQDCVSFLGL